jgi:ABC-2 type transport system permease protein
MTKSTRVIAALVQKEMIQIIRDPSSILIAVFLPIMLLFLFGYGVSLDVKHLKIGLAMEDTSYEAQSFASALVHSPYFEVDISFNRKELTEKLNKGWIRGIVVIPSYFSAYKNIPNLQAPILVIADGSETNTANFVQNYVAGAFKNWLLIERSASGEPMPPGVFQETRYWFNRTLESKYSLLSGALAIIMTLTGTLLTSLVVAREWERGTMESLISTTVTKFELVVGKLIPYFLLSMGSMLICVAVSILIFQLPFRGSFLILTGISSCFVFCALGLGLLISILSKVQIIASQYSIIIAFLPSYILSGFLFEFSSMPAWIQMITYAVPARYFVQSLQTLFLVGNVWPLFIRNTLCILFIGTIFYLIIAKKMVKRID